MSIEELQKELGARRSQRDETLTRVRADAESLRNASERLRSLERSGDAAERERAGLEREAQRLRANLTEGVAQLRGLQASAHAAIGRFKELANPEKLMTSLDDGIPLLLLPLRLELRFRLRSQGAQRDELWLRAYPDTLHVRSHEPELTQDEIAAAERYHREVAHAGQDREHRLGAWRVLVRGLGAARAAWVVRAHRPDARGPEGELTFPAREGRQSAWSRAPRVETLPERLMVLGFRGDAQVLEYLGAPVADRLCVGPDPASLESESGEGLIDQGMRWMVDFESAVEQGMGFRIPLRDEDLNGFDRLLVLGVRFADNATQASERVASLLEDHQYAAGLELVAQGTPTNNTGEQASGYSAFERNEEQSFRAEEAALFTRSEDWQTARDGQYLASALGIADERLAHVVGADGQDQRDARAMNLALWPATLGHYLQELLAPVVSDSNIEWLRTFVSSHVSGRGAVPAVRVGPEPYGILVTSAFSRWVPAAEAGVSALGSRESEAGLLRVLRVFDRIWTELSAQVSYAGKPGDGQKHLLDILGLHPSAAELHQRFAASLEELSNVARLGGGNADFTSLMRTTLSDVLAELGVAPGVTPAIMTKAYYRSTLRLDGPLVDDAPISETDRLPAHSATGQNYLSFLASSHVDMIRREDFGAHDTEAIPAPRAMLYLLARHAAISAWTEYAQELLRSAKAIRSRPAPRALQNVRSGSQDVTPFSMLYAPAGAEVTQAFPELVPDPARSMAEQLPRVPQQHFEARVLRDLQQGLTCLADASTARLARAFGEHLDLCSYRLDAFWLGLAHQRVNEMRAKHRQGVYLGAFGYLEHVRPNLARRPYTGELPQEFASPDLPLPDLTTDTGGFVHAPSLDQAATAAILRNAYLSHADSTRRDTMAVELTSERVRQALTLLDGVRQGQALGALLGYQLERGLHDRHAEAEVDVFIYALRKHFPLASGRLTQAPGDADIQWVEARNVVDGLALVRHVQQSRARSYPFALSNLPSASDAQRAVLDAEVLRLEQALDGLADLLLTESMYQTVRGNAERTAAALEALGTGESLPEPEVVRTPRTGQVLTQRVALWLKPRSLPIGPALTPRCQAEPALDAWLAARLPAQDAVACQVSALDADGIVIRTYQVLWQELALSALDLMYVIPERLGSAPGELEARILYTLRRREGLLDAQRLRVDHSARVATKISWFELAPVLDELRRLVDGSRALAADDLQLASERTLSDPHGQDADELRLRVERLETQVRGVRQTLALALSALGAGVSVPSVDALRAALLSAADLGLTHAVPVSASGVEQGQVNELRDQAARSLAELDLRLTTFARSLPTPLPSAASSLVQVWCAAGSALLGRPFRFLAQFRANTPSELSAAFAARESLLDHLRPELPLPLEEWLDGAARVRPQLAALVRARDIGSAFAAAEPSLATMQLPHAPGDRWLGLSVAPDYVFDGDRLLVTLISAEGLAPAATHSGLLLDEWTEVLPSKRETTGVAFHYDAPNSEPPQSCLLVVPPEQRGHWRWDDVVSAVLESFELAKKRAVEPTHLDDSRLAHLLPAVMLPATRYMTTLSTLLSANVTGTNTVSQFAHLVEGAEP